VSPNLTESDREKFAALKDRLEGVDRPETEPEREPPGFGAVDPMLATQFPVDQTLEELRSSEWFAERKFDGTRLLLEKFDDEVRLLTRRGVDRAETVSGTTREATETLDDGVILDCEFTFLDADGVSQFIPIHAHSDIEERDVTGHLFVFDVLAVDGDWCLDRPLAERKDILQEIVTSGDRIRVVSVRKRGFQDFFDELVDRGEEGIMIKRRNSPYYPGTRSRHWQKVKHVTERDAIAVGYTPGEGKRTDTFGALVLSDGSQFIGRVGSGFDEIELSTLLKAFEPVDDRPFTESTVGRPYTPIEPIVVRVKYQEVTPNGELRAPVFLRIRPNKPIDDVEPIATEP
jgi:bifunctional non-homologous end joining protein LigD